MKHRTKQDLHVHHTYNLPLAAHSLYRPVLLLLRDHSNDLAVPGLVGVADGVGVNSSKPSRTSPMRLNSPHRAPLISVPMSRSSRAMASG